MGYIHRIVFDYCFILISPNLQRSVKIKIVKIYEHTLNVVKFKTPFRKFINKDFLLVQVM